MKSAKALDRKRLGKQRVEAWQIYRALTIPGYGWGKHPAVKMWRGYENALVIYALAMCDEWERRGYRNGEMRDKLEGLYRKMNDLKLPNWLGDPKFHRAHRSNLIRKDSEFYKKKWPKVPDDLPYVWPI